MKSVKNFFIERINTTDQTENTGSGGGSGADGNSTVSGTTSRKKPIHNLEKLRIPTNRDDDDNDDDGEGSNNCAETASSSSSQIASFPSVKHLRSSDSATAVSTINIVSTATLTSSSSRDMHEYSGSPATGDDDGEGNGNGSGNGNGVNNENDSAPSPLMNHPFNIISSDASVGSLSAPAIKPPKNRRKISLPWFRQSSLISHVNLARQHTIDSPGSFSSLFHQASSNFKVGALEVTWIISDYIATPGSNELSVTKGQQVEIVEAPNSIEPDFCLVRLNPQSDDAAVHEGLVPLSILKPTPGSQKTNSSNRKEANRDDSIQDQQGNSRGKPDPLTSSTKRRGFSGRKWLPQPLRKLSQSKVEKPPTEKSLIKKASEKNLRLPQKHAEHEDENNMLTPTTTTTTSSAQQHTTKYTRTAPHHAIASQHNTSLQQDYEADEEAGLELPPPMKPIQEPHLMANGPPTFKTDMKENSGSMTNAGKMDGKTAVDLSEIEQLVKEKTEQHEEKLKFLKPNFDATNNVSTDSNGRDLDLQTYHYDHAIDNNDEKNTDSNDVGAAVRKRMCALVELLSTEELYIQDLSEIVNGYIAEIRNPNSEIPLPDDLKGGKERMVFGNIEAIYEWHRDYFLKALQRSQKSPIELGSLIKRYERKFHMYIVYCQNKPVSEHIVTEHFMYFDQIRQKLRHRLDLSDLLIKPVQRITKYELLLREITKQTERAGLVEEVSSLEESFQIMKVVCKAVNDMMVLRRLQKFEGKITAQGKLLLHGPLTCIEDAKSMERNACMVQKPRELQVFLFEQSIIFSDIVGKKTQFTSPAYIYRSHIQVNKMQLEELPNNRFLLKSTDPNRPDLNMVCYAATVDLNREWLETLRNILQTQHDFLKAITSPIQYQKDLTKDT